MTDKLTTIALKPGARVLITDDSEHAKGARVGNLRPAPQARRRSWQTAEGEPAGIHAATVESVEPVMVEGRRRYIVRTNMGPVSNVTGGQTFRPAPDSMKDTATIRAIIADDREQREARTAAHMADLQQQIADSNARAERDRAEARRFLAERAPEAASSEPSDRIRIERHRASVTQGEVSVFLDGELLARYGDKVEICTSGCGNQPRTHEDGAVCFGGFHGLGDAHWYEVGNRIAARRALADPVYTSAARAGIDFHALTGADMSGTRCGRDSARYGGQIRERAAVIAEHGATPCADCYPPAAEPAPVAELRHPVEGRGCASAEAAAQLIAEPPSRSLVARRVPEVGCAVYDARTGEKVSPAGERWWPNLRAARMECARLIGEDMAERLEKARTVIAAELAAYEAATGTAPAGLVEPVYISTPRRGIEYHKVGDQAATSTDCGRSTRTGQIRERADVEAAHDSRPCVRCYPPAPVVAEAAPEPEPAPAEPYVSSWSLFTPSA